MMFFFGIDLCAFVCYCAFGWRCVDLLANERHMRILDSLKRNGAVTTGELVDSLQVSIETIRRDLLQLERRGQLQRVHGGAVCAGAMQPYMDLPQRLEANSHGKKELCDTASLLVQDGDIIFIDCGSTAVFFARALLAQRKQLTIVTHSMDVFEILSGHNCFNLILCGGFYDSKEKAFHGQLTQDSLRRIHVSKAFLCPSAISLKSGIWDYNQALIQIQLLAIESCDQPYFLINSDKFEKSAMLKLCDTATNHIYITDSGLSPHYRQLYLEHGMTVITHKEEIERI
jgi:DeoR/GlpR family transcriptional regulator of sugar metabolism